MADDSGVWVKISPDDFDLGGGLEGVGGWATIEEVSGNPTRYEYPAGNPEWVAFEWDTAGTFANALKVTSGLADVMVIGGGSGSYATPQHVPGVSGEVIRGLHVIESGDVSVGAGGAFDRPGGTSSLGTLTTRPAAWGAGYTSGITSEITGESVFYAPYSGQAPGPGQGGQTNGSGKTGIVIFRVPVEYDNTKGQGSIPASVRAAVDEAVDQAKETVKETIKRNRRNR